MSEMLPKECCMEAGPRGPRIMGHACPRAHGAWTGLSRAGCDVCVGVCMHEHACVHVSVHVCMCRPEQSILEAQWRLPASPNLAFGVRVSF